MFWEHIKTKKMLWSKEEANRRSVYVVEEDRDMFRDFQWFTRVLMSQPRAVRRTVFVQVESSLLHSRKKVWPFA